MKRLAALAMLVSAAFSVQAAVDPDLKPVRISGLGLGSLPDALKPRLRVRLFLSNDEHDVFPTLPPEDKFRVFATNEVGALPLGGGGADLLDLTGATCPWLGDDPATFWVEGLVHGASASLTTEVSLDGSVIGRDTIRIRVAPFLVLSNCDVAEKLFYANLGTTDWETFAQDVTNAVAGFLPAEESQHAPFPQDVAELGWSGIGTNGPPVVWSMERNGFTELLSPGVGVFTNPAVSKMGGNIEAIPPTALYPNGRIVVGSNLTEVAKSFLRAQEVQTADGQLIELPLDWLKVGHVDEVMAVVPAVGGEFKILVGDLALATNLLDGEIRSLTEEKQLNPSAWTDVDEAYLSFLSEKEKLFECGQGGPFVFRRRNPKPLLKGFVFLPRVVQGLLMGNEPWAF